MKTRTICHKKGQIELPVLSLIVTIIGLFLVGIIVLKVMSSILTPFQSSVNNMSTVAGASVTHIKDTFVNFWDFVLIMGFLLNILVLFYSSFMVNTHPVFVVMFIVFAIFTFIFAPVILDMVNEIYDTIESMSATDAALVNELAMLNFIRSYFGLIMLGILMVCGIIIYGKYRWTGGGDMIPR